MKDLSGFGFVVVIFVICFTIYNILGMIIDTGNPVATNIKVCKEACGGFMDSYNDNTKQCECTKGSHIE